MTIKVQGGVMLRLRSGESHHVIAGSDGQIELILARPDLSALEVSVPNVAVVVCHPHSLHGGTMQNKVVTTVVRAMVEVGIPTVRFNFRGVGESEGAFAHGVGEQDDLRHVVDWLQSQEQFESLWLVGFSFGAFVAASAAVSLGASRCMVLAPAVEHFDFTSVDRGHLHWYAMFGDEDEIVPPEAMRGWYERLTEPKSLIELPSTGHFFHGQLITLRRHLIDWALAP